MPCRRSTDAPADTQPGATGAALPDCAKHPPSVVVDLPGHGGSALPEPLTIDHCVEAVRRVAAATSGTFRSVAGAGPADALAQAVAAAEATLIHAAASPRGLPRHPAGFDAGALRCPSVSRLALAA